MRKIRSLSVLLASFLTACSWGTGKLISDWDTLKDAKQLDCSEIPLHPDDLRIDKIHLLPDLGPSLLLEVTTRRGVKSWYHLPFKSLSSMDEENLIPLPVSQESSLLGGGVWQNKAVLILKTIDRGKVVIQVRDLLNNTVLQQVSAESREIWDTVDWQLSKGRLRSLVRENKDQESLDDQPHLQFEMQLDSKMATKPRVDLAKLVIGQARLLLDAQNNSHLIWLDRGTSDQVRDAGFKSSAWRSQELRSLDLADKSSIESWTFLEGNIDNVLTYIKGDTLLAANNSIEVIRLSKSYPFAKLQHMALPLSRVHVARPLLSTSPKADYLLLPQWLDHELTIGAYKIEAAEIVPQKFQGVFKEGSSFYAAFYHEPSKDNLLLMKSPGTWTSRYSLCRLAL